MWADVRVPRTFTATATDACGNMAASVSCSHVITVVDTTAPTIDMAAADATVECDGAGNAADLDAWLASNGGASASDACSGVTWSNDFDALSDDCGATGAATVTFTATDDCRQQQQHDGYVHDRRHDGSDHRHGCSRRYG